VRDLLASFRDLLRPAGNRPSKPARLWSESTLQSCLEAASQAILAVAADGTIQLVNRRTEIMFGYRREELLGYKLEILLPERHRATHISHRGHYVAEPRVRTMGGQGMTLEGRRKDGTEFPVEVGLSFVPTETGPLTLALVSDITERKQAEEEISRVNAELRRSNAELEQFVYVASHDLQEPLRMIVSYLQLLEGRAKETLNESGLEFLHYAVEGAERMKSLIQDLVRLSHTGTQPTDFRPIPAQVLVDVAMSNLKAAVEDTHARVDADLLPVVVADAGLLTQVFQNLIANSLKVCPPGRRPQIHIAALPLGGDWVFCVRDNGIGIEPQHAERIFRLFERLPSAKEYPGSGVGLAISKRIIERHGGRIWVESQPGDGAAFHFTLPAEPPALPAR
jgi:PAS domain S-box-containing protein